MKRQLSGLLLKRTSSRAHAAAAAPEAEAPTAGNVAGHLELTTVPAEPEMAASSPRSTDSPAAEASICAAAEVGQSLATTPKRRVSFARKAGDAVIQIHADGTAGAAEPLLRGVDSTSAGIAAADGGSGQTAAYTAAPAAAGIKADELEFARPALQSGRKRAQLTVRSNAVVPMPGRKPHSDEPPSRSVSLPQSMHSCPSPCSTSMLVGPSKK